ncbi:arginine N-succinyltransferase [Ideonella margarita]|uniref:Arginine N-succinyltransferase n=1 Tax=Ideonella margarita TaxID=2984191 RepID=A0ABU9BZY6_9BURK
MTDTLLINVRQEAAPNALDPQAASWHLQMPAGDGSPELHLGLQGGTGLDRPRHWIHLGTRAHAAPELGLHHRQTMLMLGSNLTGAIELTGLAAPALLAAEAERQQALLDAAVLLLGWMAHQQPANLGLTVFGALPGLRDERGQSPFWAALGQHFAGMTPAQAAQRLGAHWADDLAPLLPRHPVMLSLLPAGAQAVVSQVAPAASRLAQQLVMQGLASGRHVDLVDAGPVHEAPLASLLARRGAAQRHLQALPAEAAEPLSRWWCWAPARGVLLRAEGRLADDGRLQLPSGALATLGAQLDEAFWSAPG